MTNTNNPDPRPQRRPASRPLRLFVAAFPPLDQQLAMANLIATLSKDLPDHRPVSPEQIHLTLVFLGETDPRHLDWITESVERACSGTRRQSLTPCRLALIPARGEPRLVALETDAPGALLELQSRLSRRLADTSRSKRGDFVPHFTLCRFRDDGRSSPDRKHVDEHLLRVWKARGSQLDSIPINQVRLVSSRLLPTGAKHDAIASVPLV